MKLGVYTSILRDYPLDETIEIVSRLGLQGMEINTGGVGGTSHIPNLDDIITSKAAATAYLDKFAAAGLELAGLNCNGNPLSPHTAVADKHAEDVRKSIRAAAALGQNRVVAMSGLPAGEPGGTTTNWVVNAWTSAHLDILDYQWSVAVPLWQELDQMAGDHGVKIALEFHPHNLVFNASSVRDLIVRGDLKNVGVELDASHLFWQMSDPIDAVGELGPLVLHAAAKDTRINPSASAFGTLDNRFQRIPLDENPFNLGGDEWVNAQDEAASSWNFVAVGEGHDIEWWAGFMRALNDVDPSMWLNIEHHDENPVEALALCARNLQAAAQLL